MPHGVFVFGDAKTGRKLNQISGKVENIYILGAKFEGNKILLLII